MSRAKAVFLAALERDASLRADFVRQACAGDRGLAVRVRELIAAHAAAGARLPAVGELARRPPGAEEDLARHLRAEFRRARRD